MWAFFGGGGDMGWQWLHDLFVQTVERRNYKSNLTELENTLDCF